MTKISLNHFETTHVQVVLEQTAFLIFISLWLCKFTYSIFSYLGTLEMDGMVSLTHAMKHHETSIDHSRVDESSTGILNSSPFDE